MAVRCAGIDQARKCLIDGARRRPRLRRREVKKHIHVLFHQEVEADTTQRMPARRRR
jgi:hypothetical protein